MCFQSVGEMVQKNYIVCGVICVRCKVDLSIRFSFCLLYDSFIRLLLRSFVWDFDKFKNFVIIFNSKYFQNIL